MKAKTTVTGKRINKLLQNSIPKILLSTIDSPDTKAPPLSVATKDVIRRIHYSDYRYTVFTIWENLQYFVANSKSYEFNSMQPDHLTIERKKVYIPASLSFIIETGE